jgi:hypothetical protein
LGAASPKIPQQLVDVIGRLAARGCDGFLDHRERRAQLVRRIGQELALLAQGAFDRRNQGVDRLGELLSSLRAGTGTRSS